MPTPSDNVDTRIEDLTKGVDLTAVADILATSRNKVLASWLAVTTNQPFHQDQSEHAVADHIPRLFDALVDLLQRTAPRRIDPAAPLEDPAVLAAAQSHAHARFTQGLQAGDIVTEFRLLRQEIGRVLRRYLADETRSSDIIGAELLVNDALDGAIAISLSALAQHVDEARDDFLARTLHDVRQPLSGLKGSLQWAMRVLRRPEPDLAIVTDTLRRAEAAADQMAAILTTMMEVSRVALGQLDLQYAADDLTAIVQRVINRLDPENARRVSLHVPEGAAMQGWWDGAALERVVSNVLSNAIKYSPAETPIDITITYERDTACLSIRDYGQGLAPEDLTKIFERYTRTAEARGVPGEGLGLYLARSIIDGHKGQIWAESAGLGQGTTIRLCLAVAAPANALTVPDVVTASDP